MVPLAMVFLFLAPARAETDARGRAEQAAALGIRGAVAPDDEDAREDSDAAFTGTEVDEEEDVAAAVDGAQAGPRRRLRLTKAEGLQRSLQAAPPEPPGKPAGGKKKLSKGLVLAGGAALGALQGVLSAGILGAAAGGALGAGAAWLYLKGRPGAAFGATAGGIIGTALGGPLGGIIGAVMGAGLGFLAGKPFGL